MSPLNPSPAAAAVVPDAPAHMSAEAAPQWTAAYVKAFKQAQTDLPGNASGQRAAALKAANALIAVPAPTSAADIDTLEPWQVLVRETRILKGVSTRVCVTTDGRKYAFPVKATKVSSRASGGEAGSGKPDANGGEAGSSKPDANGGEAGSSK